MCVFAPRFCFLVIFCSTYMGFLGSSAGKESTCNSGDSGSIPGLGRSPREGISYPLQYSARLPTPIFFQAPLFMEFSRQEYWLIHVNVWQNPLQYCKVISLQLIKINEKKKIQFEWIKTPTHTKKRILGWVAISSS